MWGALAPPGPGRGPAHAAGVAAVALAVLAALALLAARGGGAPQGRPPAPRAGGGARAVVLGRMRERERERAAGTGGGGWALVGGPGEAREGRRRLLRRGVVDGESWLLGEYDSKRNWFHVRYKAQGIGMDRGPDGAVVGGKWGPTKVPYVGCQRATGQLRRFSRAQASECLRGKRGLFLGDSFTHETCGGLMDLVIGETEKLSFYSPEHNTVQRVARRRNPIYGGSYDFNEKGDFVLRGTRLPGAQKEFSIFCDSHKSVVLPQAAKSWPLLLKLFMKNKSKLKDMDFIYLSSVIHNTKQLVLKKGFRCREYNLTKAFRAALDKLFHYVKRNGLKVVWATGNGHNLRHTHPAYRSTQYNQRMLEYEAMAVNMARKHGIPFLDVYHLTLGCADDECMEAHKKWGSKRKPDGMHYNRDVARMKGQLLLNYLCPDLGDEVPPPPRAGDGGCAGFMSPAVQPHGWGIKANGRREWPMAKSC